MNHKLLSIILCTFFVATAFIVNFYIMTIPIPTTDELLSNNYNSEKVQQQYNLEFGILKPLQISSIFFGIIFFILIFMSREVFCTWKKFAFIYIPIGFILILISPTNTSSLGVLTNPDREDVTWLVGYGFLVMSMLVFIIKKVMIIKHSKNKLKKR